MGDPVDKLNIRARRKFKGKALKAVVGFKEERTNDIGRLALEIKQEVRDQISQLPGLSEL